MFKHLPIFVAAIAFTGTCFAQGQIQSRTTISFSDGTSCTGTPVGPPTFAALSASVNAKLTTNGSGGATGRIAFEDVVLTRAVDNCSVSLFGLFFRTQRIRSVTISFENLINGLFKEDLKITLSDAIISAISDSGTAGLPPQEKVSLSFQKITIFDPQTNQTTSFDLLTNR